MAAYKYLFLKFTKNYYMPFMAPNQDLLKILKNNGILEITETLSNNLRNSMMLLGKNKLVYID